MQPVVTQQEGKVRLVVRVLRQRVPFCWHGTVGTGTVRTQHSTGGQDVRLKVLQGPPYAINLQISGLALA